MSITFVKCSKCHKVIDAGATLSMGNYQARISENDSYITCRYCGTRMIVSGKWDSLTGEQQGKIFFSSLTGCCLGLIFILVAYRMRIRINMSDISNPEMIFKVILYLLGIMGYFSGIVEGNDIRKSYKTQKANIYYIAYLIIFPVLAIYINWMIETAPK